MDSFIEGVVTKSLTTMEEDLNDDERFYYLQLTQLEAMGVDRSLAMPYLIKYDGNVEKVISTLFQ